MKSIILMVLGVASAVWVLRDLGPATGSSLGNPTVVNTLPDCQSSCPVPSQIADVATEQANAPPIAAVVRPVKYSVLVADATDSSDAGSADAAPSDKQSAADRAVLGRWATKVVNALFNHGAAPAPSKATAAQTDHNATRSSDDNTCGDLPKVSAAYGSASASDDQSTETSLLREARKPAAISPTASDDATADANPKATDSSGVAALPESTLGPDHYPKTSAPALNPRTALVGLNANSKAASASPPATKAVSAKTSAAKRQDAAPASVVGKSVSPKSDASPAKPAPAATVPAAEPLSPELEALREKVDYAVAMYQHTRLLNTETYCPWEVMHRFVAFGAQTEVLRDGPYGTPVNAIGWLLWGGRCKTQPVIVMEDGHPQAIVGVGVEGHPGQFLAMLAQSRVKAESPFQLQGEPFTVQDLINEEKLECATNIELTFELIAMSYYLNTDDTWLSRDGQEWSIARLAHEEVRQPIHTAACGGTHRLFGLSAAFKKRMIEGKPVDGDFLVAQKYIHAYQAYTLSTLLNRDGSLSTDWFKRSADNGDVERKIQTTGHMLEWLVFSLDDNQLRDPRVMRCEDYIATQLIRYPNKAWSIGPLGHALHALTLYQARVFNPNGPQFLQPSAVSAVAASKPTPSSGADHGPSQSESGPTASPNYQPQSQPASFPPAPQTTHLHSPQKVAAADLQSHTIDPTR